jgi:enediyne biosynthesis protein CalE5
VHTTDAVEQPSAGPGSQLLQDDQIRSQLHRMWASVAGAWSAHADYADERGARMTERMLELAAPGPGDRVLELACGAGGLGLAAAERVGLDGEVVLSDVVVEMTQSAASRANDRGLVNVSVRPLDLEQIDEPEQSYDVVLCREGFMFALDPARAAGEIHRVLRAGGRFAVSVWGPRERNPWLGLVLDAASAQLGAPVPPPGIPGPFSLEDSARLADLLAGAGLTEIAVEELEVSTASTSFDEWWERTCALAGPLANILASLPESGARELRDRARNAAGRYDTPHGLRFPGVTLIATGRRP